MEQRRSKSKTDKSKSSIPTKSKSKTLKEPRKGEESKKGEGSKNSTESKKPAKKPKQKSPSPPPVDEYEDDFEEYESDFEDDVSQVKERTHSPKPSSPSLSPIRPTEHAEEEEVVESDEEDLRKESFLINRINQAKQSTTSNSSAVPTSIMRNSSEPRPTTSANRVFRFENRVAPDAESLMQSAKAFATLKSEGSLSIKLLQSVDVAPNRVTELFNNLIENSTVSQRFTQTGEDSLDNYSQMTPREQTDKANQFPATFATIEIKPNSRPSRQFDNLSTAERFLKFVGISGRTFISILSSSNNPSEHDVQLPLRSNVEFSAGFVQFSLQQIAKKYKAISVEISQESELRILIGFYVTESDQRALVDKSILLEYSFSDMEQPINAYLTGDEITDFSYSSDSKSLIFAGQKSGNCLLWDLLNRRQPNENTPQFELPTKTSPQFPAYTTAYICAERRKHAFIQQPDQAVIRTKALKSSDSSGQQQFLSLHAGASATIWAVTRDQFLGGNTDDDLGLGFTSLVRLMKISTNVCSAIPGFGSAPQVALCLDVNPLNSTEFLVGLTNGAAIRVCRSRQAESQIRRYNLSNSTTSDQSSVNAVCYCPQDPNYFAVGTSTGSLLIFKADQPQPIMELQHRRVTQLTHLLWSHSHTQILYALYDSKFFAIWDLSTNTEPELVDLSQKFGSIITRTSLWNINNAAYIGFTLTSDLLIHELHRPSGQSLLEPGRLFGQ